MERYIENERKYRQRNDNKKADMNLNKKNLIAKEVNFILLFIKN